MQFTCSMGPDFGIKVIKNSPEWKISKTPVMNQDQTKQMYEKRNKEKTTGKAKRKRDKDTGTASEQMNRQINR